MQISFGVGNFHVIVVMVVLYRVLARLAEGSSSSPRGASHTWSAREDATSAGTTRCPGWSLVPQYMMPSCVAAQC